MEAIRLDSAESIVQYKADCRADYSATRRAKIVEQTDATLKHDKSLVGRFLFIPAAFLAHRFTKEELYAIAN